MNPPRRRLRVVLNIEADDLDSLVDTLTDIATGIAIDRRTSRNITSGGVRSGWHLKIDDGGEHLTHEVYVAALQEWIVADREMRAR